MTTMPNIDLHNFIIYILYGWLATVLTVCAVTDLRQRRIPNLLTYPTVLSALTAYCFIGGWDGLLFSLGGLALGFAVLFLPYLLGGMGAGDIKLMSGVGAVLGFKQTAVSFLFITVCGAILALGFMVYRRSLKNTLSKTFLGMLYLGTHGDASLLKVDKNKSTQECIPYGVAITSGVFLFFLYLIMNNQLVPAFQIL